MHYDLGSKWEIKLLQFTMKLDSTALMQSKST